MRLVALAMVVAVVGVARGQIGMPEVVVTPVAHQGEPAPGIAGATMEYFLTPQIDAAGNALFMVFMDGPGIDQSNDKALLYGQPGELAVVIQEGQPAPDLGGEVTISSLLSAGECVSETGWIGYSPRLSGPGTVEGVNDRAIFVGPPGDIRKVLQTGDPAPGLEPGVILAAGVSGPSFRVYLSDAATLLVFADLAGTGVDDTNDRAVWVGSRDDLQLVYREGMPAPGCEPGVTLAWADLLVFNDAGQVAFRGGLAGDGIDDSNDVGRWLGAPSELALVTRQGDPVPGFPEGVVYKFASGGLTPINGHGETADTVWLEGPGITEDNEIAMFVGAPGDLQLVLREGEPAPEAGADVVLDAIGDPLLSTRREMFCAVKYRGPTIDESNAWAMYYGPYDSSQLTLRDSDPAPRLSPETTLAVVGGLMTLSAMNDVSDIVGPTEVAGPDVTEENNIVLWLRHSDLEQWVPLVRSGDVIMERVVSASSVSDMGSAYCNKTGGSDGHRQSFNDSRRLALRLEFADGTHGVYRIEPPLFGDWDADGAVASPDWTAMQLCLSAPDTGVPEGCELLDLDADGDVDLTDLGFFQRFFGSTR